jgi:CRISPR-associated protein Csd2
MFKHDSQLGNAPAHSLFARIQPKLKDGVSVPRDFGDYSVTADEAGLPQGVTLQKIVG